MPLCYLGDDRMGTNSFLFETEPHKRIKLRQVVDIVFGLHDAEGTDLAARISDLATRAASLRQDIATLETFLAEHQIPMPTELEIRGADLTAKRDADQRSLNDIDGDIRGATAFAEELRQQYEDAAEAVAAVSTERRYLVAQIDRLGSLEAQYSADQERLQFLEEAGVLFDDLHVGTCPACFNAINRPLAVDGHCSLCGTGLQESNGTVDAIPTIDAVDPSTLKREAAANKRRWNELTRYSGELKDRLITIERRLHANRDAEQDAARRLRDATEARLPVSVQDRSSLIERIALAAARIEDVQSHMEMWESLDRRRANLSRIEDNLKLLRTEQRDSRVLSADRSRLVRDLEERFFAILQDFQFPRLNVAALDDDLRPTVREMTIRDQSDGGKTLTSLAWTLAIFELAWERGAAHPGFLMLDSPQRGLGSRSKSDPEFRDTKLVENVYGHIVHWLSNAGLDAQVIIADNSPPEGMQEYVVAEFTGDATRPPYGLIDDDLPNPSDSGD